MKLFWSKIFKRMNWACSTKYVKLHIKCACRLFLKVDYFYLLFQNYSRSEGFFSDRQHFAYKLSPVIICLRNQIIPSYQNGKIKKCKKHLKNILTVAFRKHMVF